MYLRITALQQFKRISKLCFNWKDN